MDFPSCPAVSSPIGLCIISSVARISHCYVYSARQLSCLCQDEWGVIVPHLLTFAILKIDMELSCPSGDSLKHSDF